MGNYLLGRKMPYKEEISTISLKLKTKKKLEKHKDMYHDSWDAFFAYICKEMDDSDR